MLPIKNNQNQQEDVLRRLIQWAGQQVLVRAVLMTSSRTNPNAKVDSLSDYDIILVMTDIRPFFDDRIWLESFGEVLVGYWDPLFTDPEFGIERTGNVIQFADGLHIDFNLWPVELLRRVVRSAELPTELDDGYTLLLDKDALTEGMKAPTYRAYIPAKPDNAAFQKAVEDFFSDAPYVAKCLRRDELLPAKWCLDFDMKDVFLRKVLEWWVECQAGWSLPVGNLGKGLKKRLPPDIWSQLEGTFTGAGIADNWEAFYRTMVLFRRVASDVAEALGYVYPLEMDEKVTAYVRQVQLVELPAASGVQ